jgi:predicted flap endonuclease-1-like 5' DNA nuclease
MILHFLEVWLLFLVVFLVGCVLGSLLYDALSRSRLAPAQGVAADSVGYLVDAIKERIGARPDWRAHVDQPAQPILREADAVLTIASPRTESAAPVESETALIAAPADTGPVMPPPAKDEEEESLAVSEDRPILSWLEEDTAMMRPAALSAPRAGVPDNLQRIRGIGRKNEQMLHSLGIFHFGQIAAWTPAEARWVASHLPFPERIERDDWVGQAIILATGGDTGFHKTIERKMQAAWGDEE